MKITLNIKLGLAAGTLNCAAWYAFYRLFSPYSFDVDRYRYFVTLLLLLIGIFTSVYYDRIGRNGFIDFKDAVKTGILYTLVLGSMLAIFNAVYYKFIATDAVDYFVSEARKAMTEQKLSESDITKNLEVVNSYFGSMRMMMSTVIMGVLLSLLTGAIFRKKDPNAVESSQ
jgi:hypothetical protein